MQLFDTMKLSCKQRIWQALLKSRQGAQSQTYCWEFNICFVKDNQSRQLQDFEKLILGDHAAVWVVRWGEKHDLGFLLLDRLLNTWEHTALISGRADFKDKEFLCPQSQSTLLSSEDHCRPNARWMKGSAMPTRMQGEVLWRNESVLWLPVSEVKLLCEAESLPEKSHVLPSVFCMPVDLFSSAVSHKGKDSPEDCTQHDSRRTYLPRLCGNLGDEEQSLLRLHWRQHRRHT